MKKYIKNLAEVTVVLVFVLVLLESGAKVLPPLYEAQAAQAQGAQGQVVADTVLPSDVANLMATAGDSEVMLTWDSATDNVGVTGYKIYRGTKSVKNTDTHYDLPVIPVGAVKTYTVRNLTNAKPYYFTVTALDAAGNESENYTREVTATPQSGLHLASIEDNGQSPQVKEVQAEDVITVKILFTEAVRLPNEQPQSAFRIEKPADKSKLAVQKVEIDARDDTGKTVLLTTAPQTEGAEYIVTAGIEIKDLFDNPVTSGTADTGSFKGSAKKSPDKALVADNQPAPASPGDDKTPPTIISAAADLNNRISITFSEKVKLSNNPKGQFLVYKKGTTEQLAIQNVSLSVDEKTVYITTAAQQKIEYDIRVADVQDAAGNTLANSPVAVIVTGSVSGLKDLIAPEDVTNFIARIKDVKTNLVELKWSASKNSAGDLEDQKVYVGSGNFKNSGKIIDLNQTALGKTAVSTEVKDLKGGNWYTFKIATKDASGNESSGALASLYLPKTGPGMVAAGVTALAMGWYSKRKKKK